MTEPPEVFGIVREVGVHLADELVAALEAVLEADNIGSAESELAAALYDAYAVGMFGDFLLHYRRRAVRRVVVYNKNVERRVESENGVDYRRGVLAFVVHRYDYCGVAAPLCIFGHYVVV